MRETRKVFCLVEKRKKSEKKKRKMVELTHNFFLTKNVIGDEVN